MADIEEELVKGVVRNLSRFIILWLLSFNQYSGYGLLKEMLRVTGQKCRPGIIYPLLYELEAGGYIIGQNIQKGRRQIIYYTLTDEGKDLLEQLKKLFKLPIGPILEEFLGKPTI